jgi:hypothetical protein
MSKDIKNKIIEFIKEQNNHCLIIQPELDIEQGFKNINVTLPSVQKYPTTKLKITKLQERTFEIKSSSESLNQEVFAIINPREEVYSIAFYIEDLSKKEQIDFQSLYLFLEEARKGVGIEIEDSETEDREIIDHFSFPFTGKITIYTPKINIEEQELENFKYAFKEGNAKLRFVTEKDIDLKIRYRRPEVVEKLKLFTQELKNLLNDEGDEIEEIFQKKLESNLKILDLYGKKFISQPKGFTNEKKNIQGYKTLIPDFLIEYYDGSINLVEIERPNKKAIRKNGNPTEKLTQAISQIRQWEDLLTQPKALEKLMKRFPEINKPYKRKYTLIFGRIHHFKSESEKKEFFNQNSQIHNLEILTFDDFILKTELAIENISQPNHNSPWLNK